MTKDDFKTVKFSILDKPIEAEVYFDEWRDEYSANLVQIVTRVNGVKYAEEAPEWFGEIVVDHLKKTAAI